MVNIKEKDHYLQEHEHKQEQVKASITLYGGPRIDNGGGPCIIPPMKSSDTIEGLTEARSVLEAEAAAILEVSRALDKSVALAVRELSNLSPAGKIIVSGMGKAGFIAMKISATFASIGIPSFYLHPAEAIHGDLGRFTKSDIVLVLSNSGETPEIIRLIPHLKKVGCPVISLTALAGCTLATHSDIAICFGKHLEAAPLGVAPTVSTTVMLALGDALAMSVAHRLGITRARFAEFHPGGELGKSLTQVSSVMRSEHRHCVVNENTIVREVIQAKITTPGRPGAATVVDNKGNLVGVLTDGDIGRCLGQGTSFLEKPVSEVMVKNPKTVGATKLVEEALRVMKEYSIDELIVVDADRKPVGMIDVQDIVALQTS